MILNWVVVCFQFDAFNSDCFCHSRDKIFIEFERNVFFDRFQTEESVAVAMEIVEFLVPWLDLGGRTNFGVCVDTLESCDEFVDLELVVFQIRLIAVNFDVEQFLLKTRIEEVLLDLLLNDLALVLVLE